MSSIPSQFPFEQNSTNVTKHTEKISMFLVFKAKFFFRAVQHFMNTVRRKKKATVLFIKFAMHVQCPFKAVEQLQKGNYDQVNERIKMNINCVQFNLLYNETDKPLKMSFQL